MLDSNANVSEDLAQSLVQSSLAPKICSEETLSTLKKKPAAERSSHEVQKRVWRFRRTSQPEQWKYKCMRVCRLCSLTFSKKSKFSDHLLVSHNIRLLKKKLSAVSVPTLPIHPCVPEIDETTDMCLVSAINFCVRGVLARAATTTSSEKERTRPPTF